MAQQPLFVTGGSGFVGGAFLTDQAPNRPCRAMARSDTAAARVAAKGAEPVRCSLEDVEPAHLADAEAVVHCAALAAEWAPADHYHRVNALGTERLLDAARQAAVRRFVHVSTDSVLFDGHDLRWVDETHPYPDEIPYPYGASKLIAEQLVLAANDPANGFETVVVRPVLVWGPGDQTILAAVIAAVEARAFVWADHGRFEVSTTHITNLVHGLDLALRRGTPGEVYHLTDGEPHRVSEFLRTYVATAGVTMPDRSLPSWLVRAAGRVVEAVWGVLAPSRQPPLSRQVADALTATITFDPGKAMRELGYRPVVDFDRGIAELRSASS